MSVNLDRIAGCFDHSLSIKFANEAGVCTASWAWQWAESLGVAVGSPLDHVSSDSSQPDALGGFGLCLSAMAENYVLVMSHLPELALGCAFTDATSS